MRRREQLDIYIDESGNFAPYTKENPIYSVSFVFVETTVETAERSRLFSESLEKLPGGDSFVHVGNLVRGKKPYERMLREDRQKLFYCLFMFSKRLDMSFYSFHVHKNESGRNITDLLAKIDFAIAEMISVYRGFFDSFERVVVHYDNGQMELGSVLQSSFFHGLSNEVEFIETRQQQEPIMQVADMICYFETLYFKLKEGHPTRSDIAFFGKTKTDIDRKYLNPLRKKRLRTNK